MTKSELFAALAHLPDDAEIEVLMVKTTGYESSPIWVTLTEDDINVIDFRTDSRVDDGSPIFNETSPYFNKVVVELGMR